MSNFSTKQQKLNAIKRAAAGDPSQLIEWKKHEIGTEDAQRTIYARANYIAVLYYIDKNGQPERRHNNLAGIRLSG